jgi:alkanesulfonate monooxygenase SsuD/methylene tetrahydromethanopterin reductase-like flavin-dependent oxidoreductase (luciferase family)
MLFIPKRMGQYCHVRFGLLQEGHFVPGRETLAVRYREMVEEAVLAEESGFAFYAVSEQHFGFLRRENVRRSGTVSAPEIFLPYVAARTKTLRLRTTSTVLLTFNHPVRVAERVATLDVLSGGRAELGTARSNNLDTIQAFGVDPEQTRPIWTESLDVIVKAFTQDPFSHDGRYWQVAERTLTPKPLQKPHPPIFVSASGPESHGIAGELGIGAMTGATILGWHHAEACASAYRTAIASPTRPVSSGVNDSLGLAILCAHCAETKEQAWKEAEPVAHNIVERMLGPGGRYEQLAGASADFGYLADIQEVQARRHDLDFVLELAPYLSFGTPDFLVERFRRAEALGYDELILRIDGYGHETVMRSIELLGREVIPAFAPGSAHVGETVAAD